MKTLEAILEAVIAETRIPSVTIRSKARHQQVVDARHSFVFLAIKEGWTRNEIATFLDQSVNTTNAQIRKSIDREDTESSFGRLLKRTTERLVILPRLTH